MSKVIAHADLVIILCFALIRIFAFCSFDVTTLVRVNKAGSAAVRFDENIFECKLEVIFDKKTCLTLEYNAQVLPYKAGKARRATLGLSNETVFTWPCGRNSNQRDDERSTTVYLGVSG